MLRSLKDLERYTVTATDGDLGSVSNFLLDDERWAVRYLVVEPGVHGGRRVLISPVFFRRAEWQTRCFHLALTKDKIRNSPSVDVDEPVSRQHEREYFRYYGYPYYWAYSGLWGMGNYPGLLGPWDAPPPTDRKDTSGDAHLRSAKEVVGYALHGTDGAIGSVVDFIADDETWRIQYLVVDTSHWWFGKKVLLAPEWASRIGWAEREIHVDLSKQAIKNSPAWNPDALINREDEQRLHDHYGRPTYWSGGALGETTARQDPANHPALR